MELIFYLNISNIGKTYLVFNPQEQTNLTRFLNQLLFYTDKNAQHVNGSALPVPLKLVAFFII